MGAIKSGKLSTQHTTPHPNSKKKKKKKKNKKKKNSSTRLRHVHKTFGSLTKITNPKVKKLIIALLMNPQGKLLQI
jgi:hypothetical protein